MLPKPKFKRGINLIDDEHMVFAKQDKYNKNTSIVIQSKFDQQTKYGEKSYLADVNPTLKPLKQRVITTHNVSSLRLHQVYKSQGTLTSIVLTTYYVEGRIVDYGIHPSNEYLVVLSNEAFLYIFKLANGELRGKIQTHRYSSSKQGRVD